MPTREEEIFDALLVELQKITAATTIETTMKLLTEVEQRDDFPWIGLFPDNTTMFTAATGKTVDSSAKQNQASFIIMVYVREEDPTSKLYELLGEVKKQIDDDPKLGKTYPVFAHVDEVDFGQIHVSDESGDRLLGEMEITVRVDYRHARENP